MGNYNDYPTKHLLVCEECGEEFEHFSRHSKCSAKKYCDSCIYLRTKRKYKKMPRSRDGNVKFRPSRYAKILAQVNKEETC